MAIRKNSNDYDKLITIMIPVFNEEDNVERCYETLLKEFSSLPDSYEFEYLFLDNHSVDDTYEILSTLAEQDKRIRVLRYSKNFGFQRSVLTGYMNARGNAVVQIDVDLQDPPSIIRDFIAKWEEGYQVVYGVRQKRKEGLVINLMRKAFYILIDALAEDHLPHDAGDFRLVDRQVVDELKKLDDSHPYTRGMIASMGFEQIGIPFERNARTLGESKFRIIDYVSFALDGILYHSVIPLRLATFIGLITMVLTFGGIIFYLVNKVFLNHPQPAGFATTTILILFGISLNAMFLGIIGEYIARIYQQTKKRPISIIEKSINDVTDS